MSFFSNSAINRFNLHYAVQAIATGAGGVFILAFLLRAGFSVPETLVVQAALVGARFVLRPIVPPLAVRFGLKPLLIASILLEAAAFPLLAFVKGPDLMLTLWFAVATLGSVIYWTCFHAWFASLGDAEHRGGQIGAREAMGAISGIVAPLIGGWVLVTGGPVILFAAAGAIQALSVLPLLGAPNVPVAREAPGAWRASQIGARLMFADGVFAGGYHHVWTIALFVSLSKSYTSYGAAMALAAAVGAVFSLLIGRHIDAGHGRRALVVATIVSMAVVLLRAESLHLPWLAVIANALGALVVGLWAPALMTPVYNLAKASPCPLRFHVATEGGWDLGSGAVCLAAAGLTAAGLPLSVSILLGLIGSAASFAIVWRGYTAKVWG
jgi:MFS transporter, DHA1 family, inner membrane transport protein